MSELWIALDDFPAEGREFSVPDPEPYAETWRDLGLPGRVEAVRADVRVTPRDRGALVKGRVEGTLVLPCDRCAEDFTLDVAEDITVFEELPEPDREDPDARVKEEGGILYLNLAAVIWEQLLLALPRKPICDPACKGLCHLCGANLTKAPCDCPRESEDSRMDVFRGLKL